MRVLLVNPYYPSGGNSGWSADGEHLFEADQVAGHLGLGYVAASLAKAGHEAYVLDGDLRRLPAAGVCAFAADYRPDLLGVTATHDTYVQAREVTEELRRSSPTTPIVVGGPLARVAGMRMQDLFPAVDAFVLGEGEHSILEVVDHFQMGRGGGTRPRGLPIIGSRKPFFRSPPVEVDAMPFPQRDDQTIAIERQLALGLPASVNLLSSRGCPAKCNFCTIADYGRVNPDEVSWRPRTAQNVVDEMEHVHREYSPKCLFFMDDIFLCGARGRLRARDIAAELKRRRLRLNFTFSCRASDIDRETLEVLREAGLYHLSFGVETIDVGSLKLLNKRIRLETFQRAFETVAALDISVSTYMMLYHPYASIREIALNYRFLKAIGAFEYTVSPERKAFELLFQCKTTVRRFGALEAELGERGLLRERSLSESLPLLADYRFADPSVEDFVHALRGQLQRGSRTDLVAVFEETLSRFLPDFEKETHP